LGANVLVMDTDTKPGKLLFLMPIGCCFVLILAVLLLPGCQSGSVDALNDVSPQPLTLPASPPVEATSDTALETSTSLPPATTLPPASSATSAANNGFYPVIGRERTGAASQLSKSDTDGIRDELRQASENSSQRSTTKSAVEYQSDITELRKKAATHGKTALDKIENPTE
jgi:hypothetical protein